MEIDIAGTAKAELQRRREMDAVEPIVFENGEDCPPMTEAHKRHLVEALRARGVNQIRVRYDDDPKGAA